MKVFIVFLSVLGIVSMVSAVFAEVTVYQYRNMLEAQTVYADFNQDGTVDQVVGRPLGGSNYSSSSDGEVFVYWGNSAVSPILSIYDPDFPHDPNDSDLRLTVDVILLPRTGLSFFGASLAAADFNNDGYPDLVVGVPGARVNDVDHAGLVAIFWGPDLTYLQPSLIHQDNSNTWSFAESDDFFGHSLATGDFNCDGIRDLAVGVPFENIGSIVDSGAVQIFYGMAGDHSLGSNSFNQVLLQSQAPGEHTTNDAEFGFALAKGRFNWRLDKCHSLAVGAPGDDADQGCVFVYYGDTEITYLNEADIEKLDQNTGAIASFGEAGDRFGEILGTMMSASWLYEDLFIGAPGEDYYSDGNHCPQLGRVFYHALRANMFGIDENAETHYCGWFPPDLLTRKREVVREIDTVLGAVSFYIPGGLAASYYGPASKHEASTALLVHGVPSALGEINGCSGSGNTYLRYGPWQAAARDEDTALVSPSIDSQYFSVRSYCVYRAPGYYQSDFGRGYVGLAGSDGNGPYGFDEFINDIMHDLSLVGFYTDQFLLYGHSRGGQFASRYLWAHPDRVDRAVISSAGTYLSDDAGLHWPMGLKAVTQTQIWPEWTDTLTFDPMDFTGGASSSWWWENKVLDRSIDIVVGADEDCNHRCRAETFASTLNSNYGPPADDIETCFVSGVGHSSRGVAQVSSDRLLRESAWPNHCISFEDTSESSDGCAVPCVLWEW
jgi:pimeloyl-ACP methyl ester carboxylesterase